MNFHVPHKNEQHTPSPVALAARLADLQNFTNSELCARRVIALPRLYLDITLGFDGNLAESAVAFLVGWCIAQQILRSQLGGERSIDRKSTRLNCSHIPLSRMPSSSAR